MVSGYAVGIVLWTDQSFFGTGCTVTTDNLRNDTQYITSFAQAGFTNSFMNAANLVYLAILTSRVPIMPPFEPGADHMGSIAENGVVHFTDIWDVDYFETKVGVSLLDWREVKRMPDAAVGPASMDLLGCWTLYATAQNRKGRPHGISLFDYLALGT